MKKSEKYVKNDILSIDHVTTTGNVCLAYSMAEDDHWEVSIERYGNA